MNTEDAALCSKEVPVLDFYSVYGQNSNYTGKLTFSRYEFVWLA